MYCFKCQKDKHMFSQEDGSFYCIDCGTTQIPQCSLERPSDLPDYNTTSSGKLNEYGDDLPY